MSDKRSPWEPERAVPAPHGDEPADTPATDPSPTVPTPVVSGPRTGVEPLRLSPLLPRRQNPWLLVEVDETAAAQRALVWALREAARREATVVAVHVLDGADSDPLSGGSRSALRAQLAAHDLLEAQVLRAIAESGVQGRTHTAVLARPVFEALTAATRGADLVVVSASGKTLLRPAVPRPPARRLARGA
jgi:nucleotide-binding universal stress UspA family protein